MLKKSINKPSSNQNKKENIISKYMPVSKNDILFSILIIITSIAAIIISIKSKRYNDFLRKQNPTYYFATMFEITYKTAILTIILLIPKVQIERLLFP